MSIGMGWSMKHKKHVEFEPYPYAALQGKARLKSNVRLYMLRMLVFKMLITIPVLSMAEDIFVSSHNAVSNRFAVFEDNEEVAFLYLTEAGSQKPIKDAIAYSRVPPVEKIDWAKIKETGDVPPLEKDLASPEAVIYSPLEKEFSFEWSADGNSVALLRNGSPICFISTREKFGYSRAVSKSSNLANAWDQDTYERLFDSKP